MQTLRNMLICILFCGSPALVAMEPQGRAALKQGDIIAVNGRPPGTFTYGRFKKMAGEYFIIKMSYEGISKDLYPCTGEEVFILPAAHEGKKPSRVLGAEISSQDLAGLQSVLKHGEKVVILPEPAHESGAEEGEEEPQAEAGVEPNVEPRAEGAEWEPREERAGEVKHEVKADVKVEEKAAPVVLEKLGHLAEEVLTKIANHNKCTREKAYAIFLASLPDFITGKPGQNKDKLSKHPLGLGSKKEDFKLDDYRTLRLEHKNLTQAQRKKIHDDLTSLGISYPEHEALEKALKQ